MAGVSCYCLNAASMGTAQLPDGRNARRFSDAMSVADSTPACVTVFSRASRKRS